MNHIVGRKPNGSQFLMLVLEPGNVHKLKDGKPISVRVEDYFPDGVPKRLELAIAYSETPIADARALAEEAEVVLDERTPVSEKKRPHCPECKSTLEQMGMMRNESPVALVFCPSCGCVLGVLPSGRTV